MSLGLVNLHVKGRGSFASLVPVTKAIVISTPNIEARQHGEYGGEISISFLSA